MPEEKSIIIGCDNNRVLSHMQFIIDQIKGYNLNIISTTREYNLSDIVRSIGPVLIILCFRNNYKLLRELISVSREGEIPILCYHRHVENEALLENTVGTIFSYSFEHLSKRGYLESGIVSVLRLLRTYSLNIDKESYGFQNKCNDHELGNRNLSRYVLELDQKIEILSKLKSRIKVIFPHVDEQVRIELNSIVNSITASTLNKSVWDDFKLYFEEINPGFLSCLIKNHPGLTPIDLKYCCYLRMNMSNNDIRYLLGINQESVRTHKYRLKKKMVLSKESNLHNYVMSVGEFNSKKLN